MEKIGGSVKIRKIAVTGSLSSGKTTVCELLKARGAYVLRADDIVHDLLLNDPFTIQTISCLFGKDVISEGKVDRKRLAAKVFKDQELLTSLEATLHPNVVSTIKKTFSLVKDASYKAFIAEVPLLFEIHFDSWFDEIIFVTADAALCKQRFLSRGFSEEEYLLRLKRFLPDREKMAKATYIINNNSSLEAMHEQLNNIL